MHGFGFDPDLWKEGLERTARAALDPSLPVVPSAEPPDGPPFLPDEGVGREDLLDELERLSRGAARLSHPGWIAHMDPPPTAASVLGSASAALLNNNLLARELSPSFTTIERKLTAAMSEALGLGPGSGGVLTSGGTTANLLALLAARETALDRIAADGQDRAAALPRLFVATSADAHVSIPKAARVLGIHPEAGVLAVEPAADGRLAPDRTAAAIRGAEEEGRRCFALVATAGTTVLGAIDPLDALADVASDAGAWYHVDAAYGGPLALSPSRRDLLEGIERADSVTVNPHKWLYVARACAMALFRDTAAGRRATGGEDLPYAPSESDGPPPVEGIEGTRPADALKLRLSLLAMGRSGFEALVERSFALAARIESEVLRRSFLTLAAPRGTNLVVFRFGFRDAPDGPTIELRDRLEERADVFVSLPRFRGRRWIRTVTLNPALEESTIERVFAVADALATERGAT